jgi:hypothetical protein
MEQQLDPSDFQIAVARVFFGLKASEGYIVAGGAGLLERLEPQLLGGQSHVLPPHRARWA